MHTKNIRSSGKAVTDAKKALVMVHGRGASAGDILSLASHLKVGDYALLAPQATNHTWYPYSFMAPARQNEPWLSSALLLLAQLEKDLNEQGIGSENIYFLGFSQGACLALEYTARNAKTRGGVVAFTGGLIGETLDAAQYKGDFGGTPVFIGTSEPDPHVPLARVQESSRILEEMKANVTVKVYQNMGHTISQEEVDLANELIFSA